MSGATALEIERKIEKLKQELADVGSGFEGWSGWSDSDFSRELVEVADWIEGEDADEAFIQMCRERIRRTERARDLVAWLNWEQSCLRTVTEAARVVV